MVLEYRIRYPDPAIKVNDTVKIDLATGKITEFIQFDTGVIAMATGGRNMGRVGVITHRERHDGGFNIVHIKDAVDNEFATRESNVFVIGREKPWISLPKGKGVKVCLCGAVLYLPVHGLTRLVALHRRGEGSSSGVPPCWTLGCWFRKAGVRRALGEVLSVGKTCVRARSCSFAGCPSVGPSQCKGILQPCVDCGDERADLTGQRPQNDTLASYLHR